MNDFKLLLIFASIFVLQLTYAYDGEKNKIMKVNAQDEIQYQPNDKNLSENYEDDTKSQNKRQVQQWQVAVVVPPNGDISPPAQANSADSPGSIWLQMPRYYPYNKPPNYDRQEIVLNEESSESKPAMNMENDAGKPVETTTPNSNPEEPAITEKVENSESTQEKDEQESNDAWSNSEIIELADSTEQNESNSKPLDLVHYCTQERGQVPSPNSCNKFINCWDDTAIEQECPKGLMFSLEGYCDYALNVNCGDRPSALKEPSGDCSVAYGTYRNPENCSEFFVCVQHDPVKFSCYDGLYYNEDLGVCDYPWRTKCTNPEPLETTDEDEINQENETQLEIKLRKYITRNLPIGKIETSLSCKKDSIIRLSRNCNKVSICGANGFYQVINCPRSTAFDTNVLRCVAEHNAIC